MNVEVIDTNEGNVQLVVDTLVDRNYLPPLWVSSVRDMVSRIVKMCSPYGKIENLYILGHGFPGYQAVGCGTKTDTTGNLSLQTDGSGNLRGDGGTLLPLLVPFMRPDTIVTLGGCSVACGKDGSELLSAISLALGTVTVRGGTDDQVSYLPGMQGYVVTCKGLVCNSAKGSLAPITGGG